MDVAYCIAASADKTVFEGGTDQDAYTAAQGYVDGYYRELLEGFVQHGVAPDSRAAAALLPQTTFQEQFEWA